jgi:septation ring formation regulator EzrA
MEEIEELVRKMGQQQTENMYYRECYALLKHLQDSTQQTVNNLKELYDSHRHRPLSNVQETLADLRNTVRVLVRNACQAQVECEDLCRKRPSLSARDAFGSMAKMCNPSESQTRRLGDHRCREKFPNN